MNTVHARARAKAKITVQSSEAKPYDRTASPALTELRLSEKFSGDDVAGFEVGEEKQTERVLAFLFSDGVCGP